MRRILGAFGIAATIGFALAPQAAEAKGAPALWSVSDRDTTVYLFGTIHLLPKNYNWRTPKFDKAVAGSQELVVELNLDAKDATLLQQELFRMGFSRGLPPILDRVSPAKRAQLATEIAKSGNPPKVFDQMETWAAAYVLLINKFREIGLSGQEGVESTIKASFTAQRKPIGQLENLSQQFGIFDTLPEPAQRDFLESVLENPEEFRKEFNAMLAAWSKGDVREIAQAFNQNLSQSPELAESLLKRRNANWSRWIEQRMSRPGSVMIAVGAGHLAGNDSVIDLLKRSGYRVQRLQ